MANLNETPSGNRIRIAFFGLRNAGKSTLVNAFCGQDIAIVSDVPGTTTDPVSKAMEILPLGPCLITDTAGLDDVGPLGAERVKRTLSVLATTDIAVWVWEKGKSNKEKGKSKEFDLFIGECKKLGVKVVEYRRGESVEELRKKIAALGAEMEKMPGLLEGLVEKGDSVICVCPIDESAPKGRLILPQVQVIRECLDRHIPCTVVQPSELAAQVKAKIDDAKAKIENAKGKSENAKPGKVLIITDSQAFREVRTILSTFNSQLSTLNTQSPTPNTQSPTPNTKLSTLNSQLLLLTSFSILFARQKGDLTAFEAGLAAIAKLKDGDTVLIAEGCTHHRQCNDIGTVKIPKALEKLSGKKLNFVFTSGNTFTLTPHSSTLTSHFSLLTSHSAPLSLIVHCGGCMLTRREVLRRIALAKSANIPIVNYGMLLYAVAASGDIPLASHGLALYSRPDGPHFTKSSNDSV